MAVKTCAITALARDTAVALPETTAITAADTINITGGAGGHGRMLLVLNNTAAAEKEFTIKAGEKNPPAQRKGLGDLVIKVAEKSQVIIAIETARFANPDGTVSIT